MAPTDFLHAANTLVGILGVASANPAIAAAASGLGAAFSMQDIWGRLTAKPTLLADRIAADLTQDLTQHNLPTQMRLLIPQMIAKAALSPAQIMAAARKPDQICTQMLAQMTDPAHVAPKARAAFQQVLIPLLTRHLADPETLTALRPAFDDAMAAALDHMGRQVNALTERGLDVAQRLGLQEGLLTALARRYAPGSPDSFEAAYKSLEAAFEAAARMTAREVTAQDSGAAVDRLIAGVNRLNALGDLTLADDTIVAAQNALDAKSAELGAARTLLHSLSLDQARLLGDPGLAAGRILAELNRQPHPAGLFRALHDTWEQWYDRAKAQGISFDLNTALHLAQANAARSKGAQHIQALSDLGITQHELGLQEGRNDRFKQAIANLRTVVAAIKPKAEPEAWAGAMTNLGMALQSLGLRTVDATRLEEAIKVHQQTLAGLDPVRWPLEWAATLGNMGEARVALAELTLDVALARQALTQIGAAEAVLREVGQHPETTDRIPRAQALIDRLS